MLRDDHVLRGPHEVLRVKSTIAQRKINEAMVPVKCKDRQVFAMNERGRHLAPRAAKPPPALPPQGALVVGRFVRERELRRVRADGSDGLEVQQPLVLVALSSTLPHLL